MTKQEQWNAVEELLNKDQYKNVSKALKSELAELLRPKGSRGSSNPPKLDENGVIVEAWCRLHQRYEPAGDMIISNGKSKGLCKAGSRAWHQRNSAIKTAESKATELLMAGNFDEAKATAEEVKVLKEVLNDEKAYDYDADWAEYEKANAPTEAETNEPKEA